MVSGRSSSAGSSSSSSFGGGNGDGSGSCAVVAGPRSISKFNNDSVGGNEDLAGLQLVNLGGEPCRPSLPSHTQVQITEMSHIQNGLVIMGKEGGTSKGNDGEALVTHNSNNNNNIMANLQEKKIISEFSHLLEKSKQLFNQLRDLPPYGSSFSTSSTATAVTTPSIQIQSTGNVPMGTSAAFTCQQAYFSRAFDIYTRLWKFQQQHRNILDKKYGLKRWQIGDIASKIGQLYYHFYLRTSDINYLVEAANFYGAIRRRGYYARTPLNSRRDSGAIGGKIGKEKSNHQQTNDNLENGGDSGLIVKKLRYYARFVIVSMLLRKNNVRELLRELSGHVENYVATVDEEPEEQLEWNLVLSDIRLFIDADNPVEIYEGAFANGEQSLLEQLELGVLGLPLIINHRLPKDVPKYSGIVPGLDTGNDIVSGRRASYTIQEVIIIGNKQDQLKFSELTVDMFRMMQTWERRSAISEAEGQNPTGESIKRDDSGQEGGENLKNPHKYLLYRASIEQILANLNSAWSELTWNGVLVVYISSDPCGKNGIATVNNNPRAASSNHHLKGGKHLVLEESKEIHCFYPCDLLPLTRKPLVAIIDSDNSHVFLQLGQQKESFGQPLIIFASPEVIITSPVDSTSFLGGNSHQYHQQHHHHQLSSSNRGSIFTLFLHNPLAGLCTLCSVKVVSSKTWNGMEHLLNLFYNEALDHIREQAPQHGSDWDVYLKLIGDDFFRMIFLRYLFCHTVYSMHKESQASLSRPKSFPEVSLLSQDKIETSRFEELIFEITDSIQSKNLFKCV